MGVSYIFRASISSSEGDVIPFGSEYGVPVVRRADGERRLRKRYCLGRA